MGQCLEKITKLKSEYKTVPTADKKTTQPSHAIAIPMATATVVLDNDEQVVDLDAAILAAAATPVPPQTIEKRKCTKYCYYTDLKKEAKERGLVFKHTINKADLLDLMGLDSTEARVLLEARKAKEAIKLAKEQKAQQHARDKAKADRIRMEAWKKEDPVAYQTHILQQTLREEHAKNRAQACRLAEETQAEIARQARKSRSSCSKYSDYYN
jgi:hypothetical protein